jgi:hypothetical protein
MVCSNVGAFLVSNIRCCWRRPFWRKAQELGNGPKKERMPENREKQHWKSKKVKERTKEVDQRTKWLDFGPTVLGKLESGQT